MTKKKDLTRIEDLQEFVHKKDETKEVTVESEQEPSQEISPDDFFATPPDLAQKFAPEESAPKLSLPDPLDLPSPAATEDPLAGASIPEAPEWNLDHQAPPLPPDEPPAPPPSQEPDSAPKPSPPTHQPELQKTIDEIQQLSSPLTHSQLALGQGPPFAVAIRNISDEDTKSELRRILGEVGLETEHFEQGLAFGQILVGQINEYCAIILAHKLRKLDVEIELGLAAAIHPPQNYTDEAQRGIPRQPGREPARNKAQELDKWDHQKLFISTTSHAPYAIKEHLGPIQALRKVSSQQLATLPDLGDIDFADAPDYQDHLVHYQQLLQELKNEAHKCAAHGLIQLSFQLTPLHSSDSDKITHYQLLATGNLVRFA